MDQEKKRRKHWSIDYVHRILKTETDISCGVYNDLDLATMDYVTGDLDEETLTKNVVPRAEREIYFNRTLLDIATQEFRIPKDDFRVGLLTLSIKCLERGITDAQRALQHFGIS